jgi:hypothetical protein
MILNSLNPLQIKLLRDTDGDIILRHADRPRLEPGITMKLDRLNHSYRHYTDRPIESRKAGSELEWVIPSLPRIEQ